MSGESTFKLIRDVVERRIVELLSAKPGGWPVNWADLTCNSIERWENDSGESGWRVWISEASPDAVELCKSIADALKSAGWNAVEVRCEW